MLKFGMGVWEGRQTVRGQILSFCLFFKLAFIFYFVGLPRARSTVGEIGSHLRMPQDR